MKKNKIYAHRGYSEKYPENTLLAFEKAFACGAQGVECDLQKTKDGQYVIIHDAAVDRTAKNKKGKVSALTLAQLQTCDLGNGQTIPVLEELLKIIPAGKHLDLELKSQTLTPADCPLILNLLMRYMEKDRLLISSVKPGLLIFFKKQGITTGFIIENESKKLGVWGVLRLIFRLNPPYLNLPLQIFDEIGKPLAWCFIWLFKLLGKKIAFWTVNTEEDLRKINRVSSIVITDRVEAMLGAGGRR